MQLHYIFEVSATSVWAMSHLKELTALLVKSIQEGAKQTNDKLGRMDHECKEIKQTIDFLKNDMKICCLF